MMVMFARRQRKRAWADYLPRLQQFYRQNGHSNVTVEDDEDLYAWMESLRQNYRTRQHKMKDEKRKALKDVNFPWYFYPPMKRKRRTWNKFFPQLQQYHERNGHCNVTAEDNEDLFIWVNSLRKNYRQQAIAVMSGDSSFNSSTSHKLPDEQLQALSDLGFSWERHVPRTRAQPRRRTWEDYFPKLLEYYNRYGHSNVTSKDDKDLYRWTVSLRKNFRCQGIVRNMGFPPSNSSAAISAYSHDTVSNSNNVGPLLSQQQLQALDGIDFSWTKPVQRRKSKPRNDERWSQMYNRLVEYRRVHGDCHVPNNHGDPKLFYWLQNQRKQYRQLVRGGRSTLTQGRIEALEDLGIHWGKSHDIRWKERLQELEAFHSIYGHAEVPQKYDENPQLGFWVMNQRTFERMNKMGLPTALRTSRVEQLEDLDFIWNMDDKRWWAMFDSLKEYQEENGHLNIDPTDFTYDSLRQWLNAQRHFYRTRGTQEVNHRPMKPERIAALESLPGFSWRGRGSDIPSRDDWSKLLGAIREKGISPDAKAKQHWFDGVDRFQTEVKSVWTDEELLALWNEENDDNADDDDDDYYYEDEDSQNFLRA